MGPTAALAQFVAEAKASDISSEILERAKGFVLDNAAVAMVGVCQPVYRRVRDTVAQTYGDGKCILIGGGSATLSAAVFLNGVAVGD
jgi:2-methylcitrate dehydratase PrpD